MEASLNPGGPSPKAKYSLATDSEPSSASERWEEPLQGEDTEPETTCLQAVRARLRVVVSGEWRVVSEMQVAAGSMVLPTVFLSTRHSPLTTTRWGDGVPFA